MSDKPANYGRKWHPEDYERLKELASIKPAMTPKEIGAAMDRTANAINCKLHRMDATHGVLRRGRPPGDKRKWRPCMTCTRPFMSAGFHNRMCSRCRGPEAFYEARYV